MKRICWSLLLFIYFSTAMGQQAPSPELPLDIQKHICTFVPSIGLPDLKEALTPFSQTCKLYRDFAKKLYALKKEQLLEIEYFFKQNNCDLAFFGLDLLKRGINDCNKTSALHLAVYTSICDKNFVAHILKLNPDLEIKNDWGQPPLFLVTGQKKFEIAKLLLDHGANPNSCDGSFCTVLCDAVYKKNTELVKLLLQKGADINAYSYGRTPLYIAIENELYDIIEILVVCGADITIGSSVGSFSALDLAQRRNNQKIIDMLTNPGSANKRIKK